MSQTAHVFSPPVQKAAIYNICFTHKKGTRRSYLFCSSAPNPALLSFDTSRLAGKLSKVGMADVFGGGGGG